MMWHPKVRLLSEAVLWLLRIFFMQQRGKACIEQDLDGLFTIYEKMQFVEMYKENYIYTFTWL